MSTTRTLLAEIKNKDGIYYPHTVAEIQSLIQVAEKQTLTQKAVNMLGAGISYIGLGGFFAANDKVKEKAKGKDNQVLIEPVKSKLLPH